MANLKMSVEDDFRLATSHERFDVLDGLRGVAAIFVVLFHSYKDGGIVPNGRLAVDLFFILSGFVIAYSYDEKLSHGLTIREFLKRRFIRLYPMLFVGALSGIFIAILHNLTSHSQSYIPSAVVVSGILSILVIPYLGGRIPSEGAFTFNPPIWSLFFEILANIAYAVFRRWLSVPVLFVMTLCGIIAIGFLGPLGGGDANNVSWGIPRVVAGFFGGVLLYRLRKADRLPNIRGDLISVGILIAVIFAIPVKIGGWLFAPTFVVLWLAVLAGANYNNSRYAKISLFLGEISYPIYLTHWITLYIIQFICMRISSSDETYAILVILHLAATPFIGFILFRYYEKPAMNTIKAMLR